jgi:low temperature requirement protein LtrA
VVMTIAPYLVPGCSWVGRASAFHLSADHFVERHGLLVIVALGESVVAIGMGVDIEHLTPGVLGAIVLALVLPAGLWWTYFTDTTAAEHTLAEADPGTRSRLAVRAYIFAHIPLLLGIVAAAAGIHGAIAHPGDSAHLPAAIALAGGVALFLLGMAEVRRCLAIRSPLSRVVAAVAALATIPIGASMHAGLQLASVAAVVATMLVIEARLAPAKAHTHA